MTEEERKHLVSEVVAALKDSAHVLTDEERVWLSLAIKRETQHAAIRQAIAERLIERTITGLILGLFMGVGFLILEFLRSKGMKL